eukprot:scaffold587_cov77-Cylindrotheca_fusiformis.AAC.3
MRASFSFPILLCLFSGSVSPFSPSSAARRRRGLVSNKPCSTTTIVPKPTIISNDGFSTDSIHRHSSLSSASTDNEEGFFSGIQINPLYAVPWAVFVAFAAYVFAQEAPDSSKILLEQCLANPLTPPGVNDLFVTVFNLLGLAAVPIACIIMPSAKGQKIPLAPFLFGGIAMFTRKEVTDVTQDDLGWVTKNVFENKVFNWAVVALSLSYFYTTGLIGELLTDATGQVQGFTDVLSNAGIASATAVDIIICTIAAALVIPEDLKRRGIDDPSKATAIAASTVLLPTIGAAFYCALRPSLPKRD